MVVARASATPIDMMHCSETLARVVQLLHRDAAASFDPRAILHQRDPALSMNIVQQSSHRASAENASQ
jgi:hypothetical protein